MRATQHLREEHEGIRIVLDILERMGHRVETTGNADRDHFQAVFQILKVFVHQNHRTKEEKYLLPALVAEGVPKTGSVGDLLGEHELGTSYAVIMGDTLKGQEEGEAWSEDLVNSIKHYLLLVRHHIEKEDNYIFSLANDLLSPERQDELLTGFRIIAAESLGGGILEEFRNSIRWLEKIYLTG